MPILLFFTLASSLLFAQEAPFAGADIDRRMFMPRTLALSGNMTARINLNESIYYNPASSAHSRCSSIDGGVAWNKIPSIDGRSDTYFANALDTEGGIFGGGLGYSKRSISSGASEWGLNGIINKLAFNNKLALGVGISYLSYDQLGQKYNNLNTNFGLLWLVTQKSIIGATAYNLLGDKHGIETRSIAFGFRQTIWDFFSFDLDFEHRFIKKTTFGGALELLYNNGFMITLSGKRNQYLKNSSWGMGLGYVGPKISLIYGTMNAISAPYSFAHSVSIRVFF